MHTASRHYFLTIIFSLLTVVSSGEMHVPNMPYLQQTEWVACSQNLQPTSTCVFVYNQYVVAYSKPVDLLAHYSPFSFAFLKKDKHFISKTYQYQVASTLIGHFFRLKKDSTTSSDDDLPLIEFV